MCHKLKKNRSLNTTLSDEDKEVETDYDDEDSKESSDTMAFNAVIDLKDTSLHDIVDNASDADSFYSDEEL